MLLQYNPELDDCEIVTIEDKPAIGAVQSRCSAPSVYVLSVTDVFVCKYIYVICETFEN